jgi:hypothetical protein
LVTIPFDDHPCQAILSGHPGPIEENPIHAVILQALFVRMASIMKQLGR